MKVSHHNKTLIHDQNKLVEILKNGYSQYFDTQDNYHIFRGSSSIGRAVASIANPKARGRISAHTSNEYTLLMSNDPLWSAYPKRSESLICSMSKHFASAYGTVYAVIPPDSFRMGVVPTPDLWDGFKHGLSDKNISGLYDFNMSLRNMVNKFFPLSKIKTYQGLREVLESITYETVKAVPVGSNKLYEYIKHELKTNMNMNAYDIIMNNILHPDKNKFSIINSHSEISKLYLKNEVWTDNTCILINENVEYTDLQKAVLS